MTVGQGLAWAALFTIGGAMLIYTCAHAAAVREDRRMRELMRRRQR